MPALAKIRPRGKPNLSTERYIRVKHARCDHRVTDYEARLLATIGDRIDVDTGVTEAVADAVLAIESCAKGADVVRNARRSLKLKGYLNWRKGPIRKGKGYPNVYWLTSEDRIVQCGNFLIKQNKQKERTKKKVRLKIISSALEHEALSSNALGRLRTQRELPLKRVIGGGK